MTCLCNVLLSLSLSLDAYVRMCVYERERGGGQGLNSTPQKVE